jgi:GxxExxY protein
MEPQNTLNTRTDGAEGGVNLLTRRIIGCAQTVLHGLGTGFVEKVYERALVHELGKAGLAVSQQYPMTVRYDGIVVGDLLLICLWNRASLLN